MLYRIFIFENRDDYMVHDFVELQKVTDGSNSADIENIVVMVYGSGSGKDEYAVAVGSDKQIAKKVFPGLDFDAMHESRVFPVVDDVNVNAVNRSDVYALCDQYSLKPIQKFAFSYALAIKKAFATRRTRVISLGISRDTRRKMLQKAQLDESRYTVLALMPKITDVAKEKINLKEEYVSFARLLQINYHRNKEQYTGDNIHTFITRQYYNILTYLLFPTVKKIKTAIKGNNNADTPIMLNGEEMLRDWWKIFDALREMYLQDIYTHIKNDIRQDVARKRDAVIDTINTSSAEALLGSFYGKDFKLLYLTVLHCLRGNFLLLSQIRDNLTEKVREIIKQDILTVLGYSTEEA